MSQLPSIRRSMTGFAHAAPAFFLAWASWSCSGSGSGSPASPDAGAGAADAPPAAAPDAPVPAGSSLGGTVTEDGAPVAGARVTLFSEDLSVFEEVRTDAAGGYAFTDPPAGELRLGVAAYGREYQEVTLTVGEGAATRSFQLGPETQPGEWTIVGDTLPEEFGGTNSGILTRSGRYVMCHDTINPMFLDPTTMEKAWTCTGHDTDGNAELCQLGADDHPLEPIEAREQGCHNLTHLPDGRVLYVGGGTIDDAGNFTGGEQAVRTVKILDPVTMRWSIPKDAEGRPLFLNQPRWYPGLVRLRDGDLLAFGGGQQDGTLDTIGSRTATAETLDITTMHWTPTANDMSQPGGFGPAMLLYDGRVFLTWYPPQFYDVTTRRFSAAPGFVQKNRATPPEGADGCPQNESTENQGEPVPADHPDHSAIVYSDGRVVAIGVRRRAGDRMVEIFDPVLGRWTLGASNPAVLRSYTEVVQLPDKRVLVAAGLYEGAGPKPPGTNEYCYTNVADLYDVDRDRWRSVASLNKAREYHAITLVLPDARVMSAAGTAKPGLNPTEDQSRDNIEMFRPPYLFRGVRPRIDAISAVELTRGDEISLEVSFTRSATSVRLLGMSAVTHFLDAGVNRLLDLPATQTGATVTARLPADPNVAVAGDYLLFVMVDDIPSLGRIVRVRPSR